jgi:hypothetical protein
MFRRNVNNRLQDHAPHNTADRNRKPHVVKNHKSSTIYRVICCQRRTNGLQPGWLTNRAATGGSHAITRTMANTNRARTRAYFTAVGRHPVQVPTATSTTVKSRLGESINNSVMPQMPYKLVQRNSVTCGVCFEQSSTPRDEQKCNASTLAQSRHLGRTTAYMFIL